MPSAQPSEAATPAGAAASRTGGATGEPAGEARRRTGPIVIAYDGSEASEQALREAARLLAERRALVLVVWKSGLGFELLELPAVTGLPPAPIDIRTALAIDESNYEQARRLAQKGASIARDAGFEQAAGLVVAEAAEVPISETVVRVARERTSAAVVIGERAHGRLGEVFLGSISRDVIRYAPCPVVVARYAESEALSGDVPASADK